MAASSDYYIRSFWERQLFPVLVFLRGVNTLATAWQRLSRASSHNFIHRQQQQRLKLRRQ
jgi:hypothetical protein